MTLVNSIISNIFSQVMVSLKLTIRFKHTAFSPSQILKPNSTISHHFCRWWWPLCWQFFWNTQIPDSNLKVHHKLDHSKAVHNNVPTGCHDVKFHDINTIKFMSLLGWLWLFTQRQSKGPFTWVLYIYEQKIINPFQFNPFQSLSIQFNPFQSHSIPFIPYYSCWIPFNPLEEPESCHWYYTANTSVTFMGHLSFTSSIDWGRLWQGWIRLLFPFCNNCFYELKYSLLLATLDFNCYCNCHKADIFLWQMQQY